MYDLSKKRNSILALIIVAGILGFTVWAYFQLAKPAIKLQGVEVRQYEGQNLSSVGDFRENSIKGPQHVDINNYILKISGFVTNPRSLTYNEVINNFQSYKKVVTLDCVEGWSVNILWQGVLVKDVVKASQPKPEAKTIIFHAYDGYTTSFPIEYIFNNNILLAYKMNDVTLPPEQGFPFYLVAENKWGYKWIKWITEIEFSSDINYEGYWESRGYSDTGDLNQPFYK